MSMYLRDGPSRSNEALALEIQGGDSDAAALLLSQNEGYLTMLARRCCGPYSQHSLAEDLKQEGALALLDAARRYDSSVGTRLLIYATPAIETAMRDCAAQNFSSLSFPLDRSNQLRQVAFLCAAQQQNTEADLLSAIQEKLDVSCQGNAVPFGFPSQQGALAPTGNPEPKEFAIPLESQLVLKWVPTNGKWFVGIPFKTLKSHRQSSIREESLWDFLCRTHERTGNIRASRASVSVKEMRFHLLLSAPTIGSHIRSIRYSANLLRHRISDSQLLHRPDCK